MRMIKRAKPSPFFLFVVLCVVLSCLVVSCLGVVLSWCCLGLMLSCLGGVLSWWCLVLVVSFLVVSCLGVLLLLHIAASVFLWVLLFVRLPKRKTNKKLGFLISQKQIKYRRSNTHTKPRNVSFARWKTVLCDLLVAGLCLCPFCTERRVVFAMRVSRGGQWT